MLKQWDIYIQKSVYRYTHTYTHIPYALQKLNPKQSLGLNVICKIIKLRK